MSIRRSAALAILLAATACAPERVVFTDDEVPLAAPLEAGLATDPMGLEQDDPPVRTVRLNFAEGAVSRQPPGLDEWARASVNQPLGTGDRLWVAPDGRAELHAGATGLRLGQGTGLDVLRLDNRALQLGLQRGSVELRILAGRDGDTVEIDTPSSAVLLGRAGSYRVDVDPGGAADRVTVRSGLAEVTAAGVTVPVNPGSTLELSGGDSPRYDVAQASQPDPFDQWCAARERREDGSESALYLGRDLTGYEDLDGNGAWRIDPALGTAWAPRVPAGWAPYRNGHWVWADPWGWTWVDDAPWGFATSHYGRWALSGGEWLWVPHAEGMKSARAVYAPALVAFVGGPGFRGAASAGGGVAWFPLGPREPYLPAYPVSRTYVQNLNAGNLPPGTLAAQPAAGGHVNQGIPGAMTVVPQSVFLGARPVAGATLAVRGPALAQGWRVGSAPALVPRRESVLAALPGAPEAGRPPVSEARPLQVRRMPMAPVPFEARQQALAAGQGRPLAAPAVNGLRRQDPAVRAIPAHLATVPGPGGGMRPAHPGGFPGQPQGSRPFVPPAARQGQQSRPGAQLQQSRPGAQVQPQRPGVSGQQPRPDREAGVRGNQPLADLPRGEAQGPNRLKPERRAPARKAGPGRRQPGGGGGKAEGRAPGAGVKREPQ